MLPQFLTKLAAQSAEAHIKELPLPQITSHFPPEVLNQRACYVFVFQKPGHRLRGQFGTALPARSTLAEEVVVNTAQALQGATGNTIRPADLASLSYAIAVLAPLERITSKVHLDPALFGLYIRSDQQKSAIVLPQRTGIETADDQIATAIRESGINTNQETATMYRFYVEHYE